ncbi:CQI_4a_G0006100.mRNA.1.CDS.1 [Saccharomyces cerevisiae]|nr:CQI_4a_G0006100.mRNA.1.CDS.1 [Saccharomyces cerevisiae]CAI7172330.1 CQI_4a_G0006100.mRNA.1.CDS.1 [Saccharomyces cerevisiae]
MNKIPIKDLLNPQITDEFKSSILDINKKLFFYLLVTTEEEVELRDILGFLSRANKNRKISDEGEEVVANNISTHYYHYCITQRNAQHRKR